VCCIVVRLHCARFVRVRQHRERFGYCCVFFVSLDPSFLVSELVGSKGVRCNVWEPRCDGSQGNMSSTDADDIEVEELVRETRE